MLVVCMCFPLSGLTGLAAKVARNDSIAILAERRRNEAIASEYGSIT